MLGRLGLNKEAILLDSRLFIMKSAFAVAAGYMIGKTVPVARLDMISVLLGVMYNLEPINIRGIRGGLDQLLASASGAACTAVFIMLFGINAFTISISMALTLYVSLKINWRMVSPAAIFTCIYMTQFVQVDEAGSPSIWLTFRLRIIALAVGVLIAIIFNYTFSFLYYRKIAFRRLQFCKLRLLSGLNHTKRQLEQRGIRTREYIALFPSIFNDIDMVYSNIEVLLHESRYPLQQLHPDKLKRILLILQHFRDINHLAYDINFEIARGNDTCDAVAKDIKSAIDTLKSIDFEVKREWRKEQINQRPKVENCCGRIEVNAGLIRYYAGLVLDEAEKL